MKNKINRRKFLNTALKLVTIPSALSLQNCGGSGGGGNGNNNPSTSDITNPPKFAKNLLIPKLLTGTSFNLNIKSSTHSFFDGINTNTYSIDDGSGQMSYLGPTLKLRKGATVNIQYTNNLSINTTMHNHGMHLPSNIDGGVHNVIAPSNSFTANWMVNQKSCTNWYHSHLMGATAEQVYRGLAGMTILEDSESDALDLPKTYGVDDIPLIIQDKVFAADGSLDYSPSHMEHMRGYLGDMFLVNGVITPKLSVEPKQIRLRILNASNARVYNFSLGGKSFTQIATDNAFLANGVNMTSLKLSPAERAEIVIDLTSNFNQSVVLKDLSSGAEIMKINVDKVLTTTKTTMPSVLTTTLTKFAFDTNTPTRKFTLAKNRGRTGLFTINGVSMSKAVINQRVPLNRIEIWEVVNAMPMVHNFHIHATHFWIIERNGSSANVPANEQGYKDTVRVDANSSVKFVVKMVDYTNNTIPYMFHCHILEHEDRGMMGQFTVE